MLSLKRNMDNISEAENREKRAVGCYGDLLGTVDRTLAPKEYAGKLAILQRQLADKPAKLPDVHEAALQEIEVIEELRKRQMAEKDQELEQILTILQEAGARFRGYHGEYSGQVRQVQDKLQGALESETVSEMRRRVETEVKSLGRALEQMKKEADAERKQLENQLLDYRSRIGHLEKKASLDELTGLVSRNEGQSRLKKAVANGGPLSIIVIDMNGFKAINDTHGHHCGDMALRVFSRRIEKIFRATDTVARWGGDEFLIILPGGSRDLAEKRAEQIRVDGGGRYRLVSKGSAVDVALGASTGTATLMSGDTAESLFSRADAAMYEFKKAAKRSA